MSIDPRVTSSRRAIGQVIEWLVWSAIVGHSDRITHVFLPLDDRGVDGIVRRVDDDAMCAVQVKGRTKLEHGEIRATIRRPALDDPHVTFVFAYLDPVGISLGSTVYVIDAPTVLHLGDLSHAAAGPEVEIRLQYPPRSGSRWAPFACQLDEIPGHLFPSAGLAPTVERSRRPLTVDLPAAVPYVPAPPRRRELLGNLAELEVQRILGEPSALNTFKSFPDLEEAEVPGSPSADGRNPGSSGQVPDRSG